MDIEDVYKFITTEISLTKLEPNRYSSDPQDLNTRWQVLTELQLYILVGESDIHLFRSGVYLVGVRSMNALGFYGEMVYGRGMTDQDEIYKGMIELRNEYEAWLKEMVLEKYPEKAKYFE